MAFKFSGPVLLVGAGKMGSALLTGWLDRGLAARDLVVLDPNLSSEIREVLTRHGVDAHSSIPHFVRAPAVIVVAVKPQVLEQVFQAVAAVADAQTVVLSIAAGKPIAAFERHLRPSAAVVRSMPNTPAAVGRGISAAVANAHVTPEQRDICQSLLQAVGEVLWLQDESFIDAVTAVSGSGPAYVFLLVEALAKAGEAAGLDVATAMQLARATVSGSGELLNRSSASAEALREGVTSPGGTTAAALNVLMRHPNGLDDLLTEAVLAAKKRARELGG